MNTLRVSSHSDPSAAAGAIANGVRARGEVEIEGKGYKRYVRPIFVEPACLACHGEKDKRPDFIVKKYPKDKAFDFKVGDLRGIISVMIPDDKP